VIVVVLSGDFAAIGDATLLGRQPDYNATAMHQRLAAGVH